MVSYISRSLKWKHYLLFYTQEEPKQECQESNYSYYDHSQQFDLHKWSQYLTKKWLFLSKYILIYLLTLPCAIYTYIQGYVATLSSFAFFKHFENCAMYIKPFNYQWIMSLKKVNFTLEYHTICPPLHKVTMHAYHPHL